MSQYYDEPPGDYPQLEEFHKGPWVEKAQDLLTRHGYPPQDRRIDGLFGPMTKEAVRDFQGYWGLPVTGIIDARTWQLLEGTEA
jgi:peptidoglycan hydrolase-like protein with peptidoglycan-binding domain